MRPLGRKCLWVLPLCVWSIGVSAQDEFEFGTIIHNREFNFELQVGRADYREEVSIAPVESDWDAILVRLAGELIFETRGFLLTRLQGGFFATEEEEERWTERGVLAQRNLMDTSGAELGLDAGMAMVRNERGLLRGWAGLAYRNQSFERSGFRSTLGPDPGFGPVGERYDLLLVRAELDGRIRLAPSLFIDAAGQVGYVFFSRADNDLLGAIETSGGTVIESRLDLRWQLNEQHALSFGLRFGLQDLNGDVKQLSPVRDLSGNLFDRIVEWPDNRLEVVALALRWSCSF